MLKTLFSDQNLLGDGV